MVKNTYRIFLFFTAWLLPITFAFSNQLIFLPGESIIYDIRKMGMKVGEASITFQGKSKVQGRDCQLVVFISKAVKFYDEEKICLDPETFLPIIVERDLNIFGKKEKISEEYLRKEGKVKIKKEAGGKITEQIIEKKGEIENLYGFIYRFRQTGKFQEGELIAMRLPTKDIELVVMKKEDLEIGNKKYNTFLLQSKPKQYTIWFDEGLNKIPVRIDGALGLAKTSMVLKEYKKQ